MKLHIRASLDYGFNAPTDVLLQVEAAMIPEQIVTTARFDVSPCDHFARVAGHNMIGERVWLRAQDRLVVDYESVVEINRIVSDCLTLPKIEPRHLPAETVEYLLPSRYCPSDKFQTFAESEFAGLEGGPLVIAMRDWIAHHFSYVPGASTAETTAIDTFVQRQGICRDYAHVLISLVRSVGIPARIASVYALGVDPPDFHAVAEVFLGDQWHLIDATGMSNEAAMAKIGVGRDAADVAFLTAYGYAMLNAQQVIVERA